MAYAPLLLLLSATLGDPTAVGISSVTPQHAQLGDVVILCAASTAPPGRVWIWSSDLDGHLGTTPEAILEIPAADLSHGDHTLTLLDASDDGRTEPRGREPRGREPRGREPRGRALLRVLAAGVTASPPVVRLLTAPPEPTAELFLSENGGRTVELHRFRVESDEDLTLREVVFTRSPGSTLRGTNRARIFIDRNDNGIGDEAEFVAAGKRTRTHLEFRELDTLVPAGATIILRARITPKTVLGVGLSLVFLVVLLVAARLTGRRASLRAAALLVVGTLALHSSSGCAKKHGRRVVQVTIAQPEHFVATGIVSGETATIADFPADGLEGQRFRVGVRVVPNS